MQYINSVDKNGNGEGANETEMEEVKGITRMGWLRYIIFKSSYKADSIRVGEQGVDRSGRLDCMDLKILPLFHHFAASFTFCEHVDPNKPERNDGEDRKNDLKLIFFDIASSNWLMHFQKHANFVYLFDNSQ